MSVFCNNQEWFMLEPARNGFVPEWYHTLREISRLYPDEPVFIRMHIKRGMLAAEEVFPYGSEWA